MSAHAEDAAEPESAVHYHSRTEGQAYSVENSHQCWISHVEVQSSRGISARGGCGREPLTPDLQLDCEKFNVQGDLPGQTEGAREVHLW